MLSWGKKQARSFGAARGGNVAMLWALAATELTGMVGVSIDFAQAQSLRSQMQNAADAAALVAERSSNLSLDERTTAARSFYEATLGTQAHTSNASFTVAQLPEGGHRVTAAIDMETGLARLINPDDWRIVVEADAVSEASPPIEVALVLDNTGSMSADMQTLRDGAEEMVDFLFNIDGDTVELSLVPFVAQVNIGNSASNRNAWMDTTGIAPYNGELLEGRQIGWRTWAASSGVNCESLNTLPFSGYTGTYRINWVRSGSGASGYCLAYTPDVINYFDLYPSDAPWRGCVETRPEPYDISDDAPSTSTPASLFTPYFWVDGEDTNYHPNVAINTSTNVRMNYTAGDTSTTNTGARRSDTFNVFKYRNQASNPVITTVPPSVSGPNRGCPTPIVPLTSDRDEMVNAVRAMRHWNGGGTNQAEGLAWGWRVLSPGAPFTQGDPYGPDVRKVIVLMTDGQNTNLSDSTVMASDYSSFNHLGLWTTYRSGVTVNGVTRGDLPVPYRRNITSTGSFVNYINARQRALCDAIKAQGVEIYTVIFREGDPVARDLVRYCATDDDHYFTADTQEELRAVFRAIGSGIGELRITH